MSKEIINLMIDSTQKAIEANEYSERVETCECEEPDFYVWYGKEYCAKCGLMSLLIE